MHIHCPCCPVVIVAPHTVQQHVPCEYSAWIPGEMFEKTEFFGREHDFLSIYGDFVPGGIQLQDPVPIGTDFPVIGPFKPAKQRFDFGHQSSRTDGLPT